MNARNDGETVTITGIKELSASNSASFWVEVRAVLNPVHKNVELDFSHTKYIDSSGLSAMLSLRNMLASRGGTVRLLNLSPPVQQFLELTRTTSLFELGNPTPSSCCG
jgi:anti-anti-sigma factor